MAEEAHRPARQKKAGSPPSLRAGSGETLFLGLYLFVAVPLLAYVIYDLWPIETGADGPAGGAENGAAEGAQNGGDAPAALRTSALLGDIGYEARLILLVMAVGALGSYVHAATSFVTYVGNRSLFRSWFWWYVLRPFIGGALALIFYFVIRGGLLSAGASAESVSLFGISAIAGLVGMFSKQATDKLRELFDNLFKTEGGDQRADKLDVGLPVTEAMVPIDQMTVFRLDADPSEPVKLEQLLELVKGVVTRIPVLDHDGRARYVIHQSLLYKFVSDRAMQEGRAFDPQAPTLDDFLASEGTRAVVEGTLAFVPETATVADAKQAMEEVDGCRDVFVTKDGTPSGEVLGWLTNVEIGKRTGG